LARQNALMSPEPDAAIAQAFERALAVARKQQAKSRELRAAMSMAWLWRDQGSAMKRAILINDGGRAVIGGVRKPGSTG